MDVVGYIIADVTNPDQQFLIFQLIYASVLGLLIGWNRRSKSAGIRTFTLITLGSAIFTIISANGFPNNSDVADQARLVAQVVTGVGFLGAGVIWKGQGGSLTGLTTAAGIWVAAAVGIAVGAGMITLATISAILILGIFNLKKVFSKYEVLDR